MTSASRAHRWCDITDVTFWSCGSPAFLFFSVLNYHSPHIHELKRYTTGHVLSVAHAYHIPVECYMRFWAHTGWVMSVWTNQGLWSQLAQKLSHHMTHQAVKSSHRDVQLFLPHYLPIQTNAWYSKVKYMEDTAPRRKGLLSRLKCFLACESKSYLFVQSPK